MHTDISATVLRPAALTRDSHRLGFSIFSARSTHLQHHYSPVCRRIHENLAGSRSKEERRSLSVRSFSSLRGPLVRSAVGCQAQNLARTRNERTSRASECSESDGVPAQSRAKLYPLSSALAFATDLGSRCSARGRATDAYTSDSRSDASWWPCCLTQYNTAQRTSTDWRRPRFLRSSSKMAV